MTPAAALAGSVVLLTLVAIAAASAARPRSLEGFWASQRTGDLVQIRAGAGREILVEEGDTPPIRGHLCYFRRVHLEGPYRLGRVESGGRHIAWKDGEVWWRQGLPSL